MEIKQLFKDLIPGSQAMFLTMEKGLSMTEAAHKTNLLKEKANATAALFRNTAAYTASLDFDGRQVPQDNYVIIENISEEALVEGDLYAYSAWLKEGIKAKEAAMDHIRGLVYTEFHSEDEGDEAFPTFDKPRPNVKPFVPADRVTEERVIAGFTIGERIDYLAVEARATHLGKKLHNDGKITRIRKDLQEQKVTGFKELPAGNGMKTYLVEYRALYYDESFDDVFFQLQEIHRSLEAKLNFYKARIQNAITTGNAKVQQLNADTQRRILDAYRIEVEAWNQEMLDFSKKREAIITELEGRRLELIKYISEMKIVIPQCYAALDLTLNPKSEETK